MVKDHFVLFSSLLLVAIPAVLPAASDQATKECVQQARQEARECRVTCQDVFATAVDLCRHVDPACGRVCRDQRNACAAVPRADRERAIRACSDVERAAVQDCRARFPNGSAERDRCIDAAQIASFVCRDDAREAVNDELRVCRENYHRCVEACPPAP